ncbi:hypothetical protein [Yersinia ruckeri]|uniref:hypothetical protein n=1 Tax=Yersinia ruckeri TaxID=29486 RepID=UPI002238D596|nr:hypothetical protein [Yersinia ruckeri]MCW6598619.1 hypothetical protein [Yersinia ruckeri]
MSKVTSTVLSLINQDGSSASGWLSILAVLEPLSTSADFPLYEVHAKLEDFKQEYAEDFAKHPELEAFLIQLDVQKSKQHNIASARELYRDMIDFDTILEWAFWLRMQDKRHQIYDSAHTEAILKAMDEFQYVDNGDAGCAYFKACRETLNQTPPSYPAVTPAFEEWSRKALKGEI